MNEGTRQKTLLVLMSVLLVALAWRSLQSLLEEQDVPVPAVANHARQDRPRPGIQLATLHIADLDRIPPGSTAGRDPWRFLDPPARPQETEPVRTVQPIPVMDLPQTVPPVASMPALPELSLEYLGNFGPPERKIAVFSNGREVHNAQEGEVIDGKFIVARIGYESVDLRFVDFPDLPAKRVGVRHR